MRKSITRLFIFVLLFQTQQAKSQEFEIADGLESSLFASETQLFNPASIDVDDRGRVWVMETVNYRKKTRDGGDQIIILEDSDGDGKTDTHKVFYQGHDVDGGHGVCVLGNQVIVGVSDRIILLTDTDGDDRADTNKLLFKGKVQEGGVTMEGQHDHAIHAVMFGPDGRLYFNFGNMNLGLWKEDGTLVKDVFGNPVDNSRNPYMQGMVIRCELDGSKVEVLGYNFRNNFEVTVDSFGTLWQSDNDNGWSSCRVNYVMEYGNFGYNDEVTGLGYQSKRTNMEATMQRQMWHQNDPGVVPNLLITGPGAPTGILVYEGDLLPEEFHGQMIHAEPGQNVVWSFPVEKDGAGYTATITNILKSDSDLNYRPCDVSVAPDGSLIIADWYDPVDCCHRTFDDTGRIFRVAPPGFTYTVPQFDFKSPQGAAQALRNPNLAVRYKAWKALNGMGKTALPELRKMARDPNPYFRARALWLMAEVKGQTQNTIELALKDKQDDIRALALRIARRHELPIEPVVRRLVNDTSALVRRECAISLHRQATPEAVELWVELALQHDGKDRWYLEALGIGEKGKEAASFETWLKKAGSAWDSPVGHDIIWCSRAPEAATYLTRLLLAQDVSESESKRFMRALDFHKGKTKEAALTAILSGGSKSRPWAFLEALQRIDASLLESRPDLMDQVETAIPYSKGTVTFVDLVERFDRKDLSSHLMDMVIDNPIDKPGIRAIQQLLIFGEQQRILGALQIPDYRRAIIEALGYADSTEALAILQGILNDNTEALETRSFALESIGKSNKGGNYLVDLVKNDALPKELHGAALRTLSLSPNPGPRRFVPEAQKILAPGEENQLALEELLAATPDPTKGKAVFQKAACNACHVIQGEGIDFGPELSAIGDKLSRADMFSAIMQPNQTISLGFEGFTVELEDGTQFAGYISGESETTLSLRMMGGLQNDLDVSTIKSRHQMKDSLMPTGLDLAISSNELVDLVGWLMEQKAVEHN